MRKPLVAIVGRPNVGKSTLFNKIVGKRVSIVEDKPGVTRDRIYMEANWLNYSFNLIDTGGIELETKDIILSQMLKQVELAVDTADVIIFVLDGKSGLTSTDREIAQMLRKSNKKVILAINKVDNQAKSPFYYDFFELGFDGQVEVSATQALGIGDLLDEVTSNFDTIGDELDEDTIKVAIIGKPNVGKSSIVNKILGEERVIVSDIAGTTRDAIDTPFEINDDKFVFIDTAGIRRKSKVKENTEKYSIIRSISAVERADVCLLVIDALEGVTEQDKKIAGYSHEEGKAMIIVINKWDLVHKNNKTMNNFIKKIRDELAYCEYAPIMFISALTGQRMNDLLEKIKVVFNHSNLRVKTGLLNDIIGDAILLNQPPSDKGKRLKIYYCTQGGTKPPTFILFVNNKDLAHFSYLRYLTNKIRESFEFQGSPVRIIVKERKEES